MNNKLGLYLHVPFCRGKCPYCDFYSVSAEEALMDEYTARMTALLEARGADCGKPAVSTVYFGGGTPNLLGSKRLKALLCAAQNNFFVLPNAEITLECNPSGGITSEFFRELRDSGFNRVSMGLQSANGEELRLLGRRHSAEEAERTVRAARDGGFSNISLDIMLGLPEPGAVENPGAAFAENARKSARKRLESSIAFAASLGVEHISSYILKVEEGTPFAARGVETPPDDEVAQLYLFCVDELKKYGYEQYEISNFAKKGRESRHNLLYWHGDEYLGFGPAAHSFYKGRRFFYPRDINAFLGGCEPVCDGIGGDIEEYAMLNLRLSEGLLREKAEQRFGAQGAAVFEKMLKNTKKCPPDVLRADKDRIYLTPKGFLLSNAIILKLLDI